MSVSLLPDALVSVSRLTTAWIRSIGIGTKSPNISAAKAGFTFSTGQEADGERAAMELRGYCTTDGAVGNYDVINGANRLAAITGFRDGANNTGKWQIGLFIAGNYSAIIDIEGDQTKISAPTLGNPVLVLTSAATNDDPTETVVQGRTATTDATVTTLHTFTVPASTTYAIEAIVIARRTGGAAGTAEDGARYKLSAVYKNVAGTATLIGAATVSADEDQAAWDCAISPTGGTVRIRVTGAVDNSITWHMTARVYAVGS